MTNNFKETFTEHLKKFQTAPFLFIGSGLSRRYLNLENWEGLLRKYSQLTGKDFEYYLSAANSNFPKIATNIAEDFFDIWWENSEYDLNRKKFKSLHAKDRKSPLKIEISNYFSNLKDKLTTESELLLEIDFLRDSVIDGIITTNWDHFLENIFKDFVTYIGQEELIFAPSQGIGEIYKIHGCCSKPNSLVLTDEDYSYFDKKNAYLAAKLITIFTEHPVIFIGYSLNDENINQILKSILICLTDENVARIQERLIFVNFNSEVSEPIIYKSHKTFENYQIPITTIDTNSFIQIFEVLKSLKRKIPAKILRKLKEQVYDFVVSSEAREKLFVMDINDNDNNENLEVVYGVGIKSRLKESSYIGFSREELYEDIIFENKNFESDKIIKLSLPKMVRTSKNFESIPIFKYLRGSNLISDNGDLIFRNPIQVTDEDGNLVKEERIPEKLIILFDQIIKDDFKYYYPSENYVKNFRRFNQENKLLKIDEYIQKNGVYEFLKYFTLFYPNNTIDEIHDFLKTNFEKLIHSENGFENSQFKKMICWFDYIKNYKLPIE